MLKQEQTERVPMRMREKSKNYYAGIEVALITDKGLETVSAGVLYLTRTCL